MTDRELLELAAKAYWGDEIGDTCFPEWSESDQAISYTCGDQDYRGCDVVRIWNPLEDDGDAFRLFVTLRMAVEFADCTATLSSAFAVSDDGEGFSEDVIEGDANAAMRRAIVRAAAEVGRRMP
jgi:hypothetical protein